MLNAVTPKDLAKTSNTNAILANNGRFESALDQRIRYMVKVDFVTFFWIDGTRKHAFFNFQNNLTYDCPLAKNKQEFCRTKPERFYAYHR
jgi:hypothetical protein